ncbi:hypothetical protein GCM10011518_21300 [Flavobacterium limi]|uniref:Uncharacterized protein n=1 Tax=Flavobacterium limi TaxID=2045105 RepID=A0ABQ1UAW4_9FLAO|nr:hypothetical protein GCM10011518_21300 [Flavobacterium limi]
MDLLGGILLMTIIIIIVLSNILFFKRLKKNQKRFKYIILFLSFCIFSIFIFGILTYAVEQNLLLNTFKIEINHGYTSRILKSIIALTLNIITNYYFAKFYLKRIYKQKTEIELIGKE